ncbi:MAG: NrfD/PsrC family molybdoenzyme membrane anchor subunit [Desulfohalobiaceae bacterium]
MQVKKDSWRSVLRFNKDVPAIPFIILGAVLLLLGAYGVLQVLIQGHEAVYAVNREVPWGLLIATYAYFVITSTGLAFIGGLGHAFGYSQFAPMSRRIVLLAFITLLAGFTQIGMELGHPFRLMIYFLLSPQFSAPIVWMGVFYSIELVILAVELYILFRPGRFSPKAAGITGFLALVVGVIATSNLGFVFGSINARPFFHGSYFPVFLVVSGIVGGAALLTVVYNVVYKLRIPGEYAAGMKSLGRVMGLGIAGTMVLYFWKFASSLYTQPEGAYEAAQSLLTGPLAAPFWIGEVGLALLVPLVLILWTKGDNPNILGLSGVLYLLGMFFTRYDFIVAGQLPPMREGLEGSGVHTVNGLAQYAPSSVEWMVFCLAIGVFFLLYFLAERYLDLEAQPH